MTVPFNIDSALDVLHPRDVQLSPDGTHVAFVLASGNRRDAANPPEKSIQLINVASGVQHPLTGSGMRTNEAPRWSPDSRRLAFVSNRLDADEMQLFLIDIDGGEAQALTNLRGAVSEPTWTPDGQAIAFLFDRTDALDKTPAPDPIVVDASPAFNRLWLVDVTTRRLRAITPTDVHIHEYAIAPDGQTLALVVSAHPNPLEGWYAAQIYTMPVDGGELHQVCTMPDQIGRLTWSSNSQQIAFISGVMSDEGNIGGEVFVVPAVGGEARNLTPGLGHTPTWIHWRAGGILYTARHIEGALIGWIDVEAGGARTLTEGEYALNGSTFSEAISVAGDTFAVLRESFTEPPNIYLGSLTRGEWTQQLTYLPLDTTLFPPLHVENKYWTGEDGTPVHGWVVYPPGYVAGTPYPMVVNVHGGPSLSITPSYISSWVRLFTSLGCTVLLPNPRGSWGRGHAFQRANVGDLGGGDWQDIQAGIDLVVSEGIADPDHLAVAGWSYSTLR